MDNYKVEGKMVFEDNTMLTWGPFYYHDEEKVKQKIPEIFEYIINCVNQKDPLLNIQATNIVETRDKSIKAFNCKAWKTDTQLEDVACIIEVNPFSFEDEPDEK